jgi:ParB-like chromosome segregation protein Spo0J
MPKKPKPAKGAPSLDLTGSDETPDITIEYVAVADLVAYARNSRTHSPEQIAKLAQSIRTFGFTNPVLIREDRTIVAGHGRVLAAQAIGRKRVPTITCRGWTDAQVRAYVITDNKLALDAGWDEDLLKLELGELAAAGFDLELTGFSEADLDQLFGKVADDAEPPDTGPQLSRLSYSVVVRCDSEAHQSELLDRFTGEGLKCDALIS